MNKHTRRCDSCDRLRDDLKPVKIRLKTLFYCPWCFEDALWFNERAQHESA